MELTPNSPSRRLIIPRFSVRWLLILMAASAVGAFLVSLAVSGRIWAIAFSIALAGFMISVVFYAVSFLAAWAIAELWRFVFLRKTAASPFATHQPPPRLLRTEDPE
jgi:hypothetical protein